MSMDSFLRKLKTYRFFKHSLLGSTAASHFKTLSPENCIIAIELMMQKCFERVCGLQHQIDHNQTYVNNLI